MVYSKSKDCHNFNTFEWVRIQEYQRLIHVSPDLSVLSFSTIKSASCSPSASVAPLSLHALLPPAQAVLQANETSRLINTFMIFFFLSKYRQFMNEDVFSMIYTGDYQQRWRWALNYRHDQ